jgi:hypothetical protein
MRVRNQRDQELAGEIARGDTIRLGELAKRFAVCPTTVFRWVKYGLPVDGGDRAYLAAVVFGRKLITSQRAVERFISTLTPSSPAEAANGTPPVEGSCQPETINGTEETQIK